MCKDNKWQMFGRCVKCEEPFILAKAIELDCCPKCDQIGNFMFSYNKKVGCFDVNGQIEWSTDKICDDGYEKYSQQEENLKVLKRYTK